MIQPGALTEQYRRLRESLLAEFPELCEDDETLADTLEGITELPDVAASYIRKARDDEAQAEALGKMLEDMRARRTRLTNRADKRRAIAAALMDAVGMKTLNRPDFTASLVFWKGKVVITDEAALPDIFVRVKREPDKKAIADAIHRGEIVAGAEIGNGHSALMIRTT